MGGGQLGGGVKSSPRPLNALSHSKTLCDTGELGNPKGVN